MQINPPFGYSEIVPLDKNQKRRIYAHLISPEKLCAAAGAEERVGQTRGASGRLTTDSRRSGTAEPIADRGPIGLSGWFFHENDAGR